VSKSVKHFVLATINLIFWMKMKKEGKLIDMNIYLDETKLTKAIP
jgi:hypothetical protein